MHPPGSGRDPSAREMVCVTGVAAVAFATFAWPWVRGMDTSIPDAAAAGNAAWGADARLIVWILGWVAHALVTAPARLFDANIFHPLPRMLTGSEHLASSVLFSGPVYAATGNPVLAANVAAMSTYVLAVVAGYALMRAVRLPVAAAGAAAAAFALGPLQVPADLHVLQYPTWYLALVLLAAVRVERGAHGGWLAASATLAAFSSYYVAAMTIVLIALETEIAWWSRGRQVARRLLAVAAPAFAVLAIFSLPYLRAFRFRPVMEDPTPWVVAARWVWGRVLDPSSVHFGLGWALILFAGAGFVLPWLGQGRPGVRWWRWILIIAGGTALAAPFTLTIGRAEIPMPSMLLADTPLRANTRFILLAHLGLVGLAAEGVATVDAWLAHGRRVHALGRALVGGLLIASVAVPRARHLAGQPLTVLPTGAAVPAVYRWLAANATGPLLEPPGPEVGNWLAQGDTMVLSLHHWLPLLNGHTGFVPWAYQAMTPEFARLPEREALQALVDLTGVQWVLVRRGRVPAVHFDAWERFARADGSVRREPAGEPDLLLRVTLRPRHEWAAALARMPPPDGRTALGTSLVPLDDADVRGRVTAVVAPRVGAAGRALLAIRVENAGTQTWPVMVPPGAPETGAVRLRMRWSAEDGAVALETSRAIPRDVAPGETVGFRADVEVPAAPGTYWLDVFVAQLGAAAMRGVKPDRVAIVVTPAAPT